LRGAVFFRYHFEIAEQTMERTCLLVDDNRRFREFVRTLLQTEKIDSLEAENAADALRLVQATKDILDIIVTDISIPGDMSGLDFAIAVKKEFPTISIMLMSGYPFLDRAKELSSEFELIEKPFTSEDFLLAVRKMVCARKPTVSS
jgi:DNA-binding NtrC family response regulator